MDPWGRKSKGKERGKGKKGKEKEEGKKKAEIRLIFVVFSSSFPNTLNEAAPNAQTRPACS
jgi:hypothetical protein